MYNVVVQSGSKLVAHVIVGESEKIRIIIAIPQNIVTMLVDAKGQLLSNHNAYRRLLVTK